MYKNKLAVFVCCILSWFGGLTFSQPSEKVPDNTPNSPAELVVTRKEGKAEIEWLKSVDDGSGENDVTGYAIYRSKESEGGRFDSEHCIGRVDNGITTFIDDYGLENETETFYYMVRSRDGIQESGALHFDGADAHVNCGNGTGLNMDEGDFTVEAWIKPEAVDNRGILCKAEPGLSLGYRLECWNGQAGFLVRGSEDTSSKSVRSDSVIIPGQWYHVMGVASNKNMKLYLNGVLQAAQATYTGSLNNGEYLELGRLIHNNNYAFCGIIDEVRIYKRALTENEVKENYSDTGKIITDGLVSWWKFNEVSGTIAKDSIGKNDGVFNKEACWTVGKKGQVIKTEGSGVFGEQKTSSTINLESVIDETVKARLKLQIHNVSPETYFVAKFKVYDDTSREVKSGIEEINMEPSGTVDKEIEILPTSSDSYRVEMSIYDKKGRLSEKIEKTFGFEYSVTETREMLSLSGQWDFMAVNGGELKYPPQGEWIQRVVPDVADWVSQWNDKNVHWFWYKREFTIPKDMFGKRLKLKFMAVNFDAQVYVNGRHAGGHFGGYTPFILDITDLIKKDGPNELCVAVTDWVAASKKKPAGTEPSERNIIAPIGGNWRLTGIWQPVYLVVYPAVYVEDTFIMTSVRKKELKVQVQVKNEGTVPQVVEISNSVCDGDKEVKLLQPQKIEIAPNQSQSITLVEKWDDPHLWSLDDPYLYKLKTTIQSDNGVIDELTTRFGFREVWTEGKRFILNGVPITLFAADQQTMGGIMRWTVSSKQEAFDCLNRVKKIGIRSIRLHTQPLDPRFLEAADEVGILIVDEGAVYCGIGSWAAIEDKTFWENYARHMRELIFRDRNHPSLYMYSLGNEVIFAAGGGGKIPEWKKGWVELSDIVRTIDPTRLVIVEADDDPGGKMDMRGFHYTAERYQANTDYPNKCYNWIDKLDEYMWQPGWRWTDKPIYYGEFAGYMPYHPHQDAFWLGDNAYIPDAGYMRIWSQASVQTIVDLVVMEIAGLRYQGVTGICPYTYFPDNNYEVMAKRAFSPLFIDMKELGHNYRSGETIEKTLLVYNDLFKPLPLRLTWQAKMKDEVIATGELIVDVHPGEFKECKVSFTSPQVSTRSKLNFEVVLYNGEEVGYKIEKEYTMFPSLIPAIKTTNPIGLYDTTGQTEKILNQLGIKYMIIRDLAEPLPPEMKVLVLGAGSLNEKTSKQTNGIGEFVSAGGRVICFEQEEYPPQWLPVQLSHMEIDVSKKHTATVVFPRATGHPLLEGIETEDFKFWRQDNIVAKNSPLKPLRGNFKIIIDAGGISCGGQGPINVNGLSWVPLIEIYYGKGFYLYSQLSLVEKYSSEPIAQDMLVKMLNYADQAQGHQFCSVGVVADAGGSFSSTLKSIGLVCDDLTGKLAQTDFSRYRVLVIGGSGSVWNEVEQARDKLKGFVQSGGIVWLHNLQPEQIESLQPLLDLKFKLQKASIEPLYKIQEDEIISGLSNHELYWREEASFDQIGAFRQIIENSFEAEDTPTRVKILTNPAGLVKVGLGKGFFLIDQVMWDTTVKNRREGMRIATILLTNLGAQVQGLSARAEDYFNVNIASYCNLGFSDEKEIGWSDSEKGFRKFPVGSQALNGIPFRVIDPLENDGKSVIALGSNWKSNFPKEVSGIGIGQKAQRLYFLHSCAFQGGSVFGRGEVDAGKYIIHYSDGSQVEIPVRNNLEVWEYWAFPVPRPNAEVAWIGRRPGNLARQTGAYMMEWLNPHPDKSIDSLDFISSQNEPVPILIAITGSK